MKRLFLSIIILLQTVIGNAENRIPIKKQSSFSANHPYLMGSASFAGELGKIVIMIPIGLFHQVVKFKNIYKSGVQRKPWDPGQNSAALLNAGYQVIWLDGIDSLRQLKILVPEQFEIAFSNETLPEEKGVAMADLVAEAASIYCMGKMAAGISKIKPTLKPIEFYSLNHYGNEFCLSSVSLPGLTVSGAELGTLMGWFEMGSVIAPMSVNNIVLKTNFSELSKLIHDFKMKILECTSVDELLILVDHFYKDVDYWVSHLSREEMTLFINQEFQRRITETATSEHRIGEKIIPAKPGYLWGLNKLEDGSTFEVLHYSDQYLPIQGNSNTFKQFRALLEESKSYGEFNLMEATHDAKLAIKSYPLAKVIERYIKASHYAGLHELFSLYSGFKSSLSKISSIEDALVKIKSFRQSIDVLVEGLSKEEMEMIIDRGFKQQIEKSASGEKPGYLWGLNTELAGPGTGIEALQDGMKRQCIVRTIKNSTEGGLGILEDRKLKGIYNFEETVLYGRHATEHYGLMKVIEKYLSET